MRKSWKKENHPIDSFYNELEEFKENKNSKEIIEQLEETSEILKVLDEPSYDFSINTMDIIHKVEEIKIKRVTRKEVFFFLIIASFVLTLYLSFAYFYGARIILYTQIFLVIVAPWILIPISISSGKGAK